MIPRRLALLAAVAILAVVGVACSSDEAARDEDGRITSTGQLDVFDLEIGDCIVFDDMPDSTVEDLTVTPCDEPHQSEVYALVEVDDLDAYPGERELSNRAELECVSRFEDYVGIEFAESTLFSTYLIPTVRSWQEAEDREIVCLVVAAGRVLEDSVEGSAL